MGPSWQPSRPREISPTRREAVRLDYYADGSLKSETDGGETKVYYYEEAQHRPVVNEASAEGKTRPLSVGGRRVARVAP